MNSTATKQRQVTDSYMALIEQFALRPIRNRKEYAVAEAMLDRLALLDDKLDPGEVDYLETLELLIEAYDLQHAVIEPHGDTPLERLKYLIEQNGLGSSALGDLLGSRPLASMILKGERSLSKTHIRKLAERFCIDAGFFL
jgi:HTH-type transcriptional regulator/antitoxin HigA